MTKAHAVICAFLEIASVGDKHKHKCVCYVYNATSCRTLSTFQSWATPAAQRQRSARPCSALTPRCAPSSRVLLETRRTPDSSPTSSSTSSSKVGKAFNLHKSIDHRDTALEGNVQVHNDSLFANGETVQKMRTKQVKRSPLPAAKLD